MSALYFRFFLLLFALFAGVTSLRAQAPRSSTRPPEASVSSYQGHSFPRLRTPIEQLPWEGQAEILRLETLLQRAYVGLLADTAAVLPQTQADVIDQAARQAAAVAPAWNHQAYKQEAAFYAAEEARRFPTAKP